MFILGGVRARNVSQRSIGLYNTTRDKSSHLWVVNVNYKCRKLSQQRKESKKTYGRQVILYTKALKISTTEYYRAEVFIYRLEERFCCRIMDAGGWNIRISTVAINACLLGVS